MSDPIKPTSWPFMGDEPEWFATQRVRWGSLESRGWTFVRPPIQMGMIGMKMKKGRTSVMFYISRSPAKDALERFRYAHTSTIVCAESIAMSFGSSPEIESKDEES